MLKKMRQMIKSRSEDYLNFATNLAAQPDSLMFHLACFLKPIF